MRISERVQRLLIFSGDAVLLLHPGDLLLLLLLVELLAHLRLLIVEHDQVPVRNVEAREVVDRRLGVVDILVHDEGRTASVLVRTDSDLPNRSVLAEDVVHLLAGDIEGEVPHVQHAVHLRREPGVALAEADRRH